MDGLDAIVIREASPEAVGALVGFDSMAHDWLYSGTLDGLDPGDPEEFYYIDG